MSAMDVTTSRTQRGAVLVISLFILSLMSLIGATAMQTTVLEERMAGNLRDQGLAFQSAEAALRNAEEFIEGLVDVSGFTNSGGLYTLGSVPDLHGPSTWQGTASIAATSSLPDVSTPHYLVEERGRINAQGGTSINIGNYGSSAAGGMVRGFRIIARGTGGTGDAQAILESYYGKQF